MPRATKKKAKVTVVRLNDLETRKDPKAGLITIGANKGGKKN